MFELSILLLALFIAGLFSCIHTVSIALPPKAKLLCDAWKWAESKKQTDNSKPQISMSQETNTAREYK